MAGSKTNGTKNKKAKTFTMHRVPRTNEVEYFKFSSVDIFVASNNNSLSASSASAVAAAAAACAAITTGIKKNQDILKLG